MSNKLYWNTPRIQIVNKDNIYKLYNDFIRNVSGEKESDLSHLCIKICEKTTNNKYYGHIITLINLLGLLQYKIINNNLVVDENTFLSDNMNNAKFVEKYLDYSLTYFQYPRHNVQDEETSLEIRKPFLIILELLKKLYDKDEKESYLTKNELYHLFNRTDKPYKNFNDINNDLISLILKDNRAYGKNNDYLDMQYISYDLAFFKNSSVLTFNSSDYADKEDFAFGLSKEYNVIAKLHWLLSPEVKNDTLSIDISLDNKAADTRWAKFLNNKDRFKEWESNVFYSNEDEELGSDGLETGIENDYEAEEDFITPFNPDEISIDTKPISLDSILRRLRKGTIKLNPPFQRNSVWDDTRKSRLIESMMLKIPLPTFYISSDKDNNWDVVDGRQRLTAIKEFILGKKDERTGEYDENGFKLKKLEFWDNLDGKKYEELPGKIYNNIAETEFRFTIINPNTPEELKRNIFKRINTGGMPLTSQEIRHALYQGDSASVLKMLAEDNTFLNAVDRVDDSRMGARELILRYLSFYIREYTQYKKDSSMDKYLSDTMRIINNLDKISFEIISQEFKNDKNVNLEELYSSIKKVSIDKVVDDFRLAMRRARKLFNTHTFRKSFPGKRRTPINKTLFEVFGNLLIDLSDTEFNNLLKNKKDFLNEYKNEYLLTVAFAHMIGRDSHRVSSVKIRYQELSVLIKKYI